jgi:hypothetical protein
MRKILHLLSNERGLAAVEFAFILPIMLSMLLGLTELSRALACRADITNMASAGADLISQEVSAGGADLDNVFNAVAGIIYPFDPGPATITVTSVIDAGAGKSPIVAWSCTKNGGTTEAKGSSSLSVPLPAGLITPGGGGSVIWSKITYPYVSPLNYFLQNLPTWTSNFYAKPRRVLQIPLALSGDPTALGTCVS